MSEIIKITQEQYDQLKVEKGYEDMTEEEKERFDKAMDELFEVDDSDSDSEQTETTEIGDKKMVLSRDEVEDKKTEMRDSYGYDEMSEEQQEAFDEKLDQFYEDNFDVIDDEKEQDKADEGEKVKKLIR